MRKLDRATADTYTVEDVEVARWEQFGLGGLMPFNAMWYVVPPGAASPVDCHPELELSVVVSGEAVVHAGGRAAEVEQGSGFLIESHEDHMVSNRSPERPLVVFSAYWTAAEETTVASGGEVARA
jgi:mannose-6-phosphate isomerase-like protein (cupin superfamily)